MKKHVFSILTLLLLIVLGRSPAWADQTLVCANAFPQDADDLQARLDTAQPGETITVSGTCNLGDGTAPNAACQLAACENGRAMVSMRMAVTLVGEGYGERGYPRTRFVGGGFGHDFGGGGTHPALRILLDDQQAVPARASQIWFEGASGTGVGVGRAGPTTIEISQNRLSGMSFARRAPGAVESIHNKR